MSLTLYQQLAKGKPVSFEQLAKVVGQSIKEVEQKVKEWPGVYYDDNNCVIAYWGITIREMPHRMLINNISCYGWCAWDTLFIPQLLNETAQASSSCPVTSEQIELIVSPQGFKPIGNTQLFVSFLEPEPDQIASDVVGNFCHFVYFFKDQSIAEKWLTQHPGTFLLSQEEAFSVGQEMNNKRYNALTLATG